MMVVEYVEVRQEGFYERLAELGYSGLSSLCGQQISGVRVCSRNTYRRALSSGRMTESAFNNLVRAIGEDAAYFLITGWRAEGASTVSINSKKELDDAKNKNTVSKKKAKKNTLKAMAIMVRSLEEQFGMREKDILKALKKELKR